MKMENGINAECDGTITEIKVKAGDSILEGTDIVSSDRQVSLTTDYRASWD